ncbi:uncharacterized protein LOC123319404 [Coccinella septempunctata]|uniref:uncharacterized protein LOC123319404 n=1 Tax=Coccinella septempunctata TaxID=41139 RepID=UPI001D06C9D1|nr:uncharacterized protein LOC123319404 [Coccinella septempunctata]
MVLVEEQTSVYSGQSGSMSEKKGNKNSEKERRKRKLMKKLKCNSWRINRLAIPRYRVEKFYPKPYEPIDLKPPEPLDSDLEEHLEELSQPRGRIIRENECAFQQAFVNKNKRREELLASERLQKSKNVISNSNDVGTTCS